MRSDEHLHLDPVEGLLPPDADLTDPAVAMLTRDVASAVAGLSVVSIAPGHAVVRMTVDERHVNGHDIAHGGYLFLLADTAFACACNSGRTTTVAAMAEIDFLSPARRGDVLEATAVERVSSGRSGISDVTVRRIATAAGPLDGPDEVVAEFRGRSRTLRTPD